MKTLSNAKVGDEVVLRDVNRRAPETVVVTRVGRKLIYVQHYGRERAFRLETGEANDGYGHSVIRTFEEDEARTRRHELVAALYRLGVKVEQYGDAVKVTNDQLERILAIVEEP